MTELRFILFVIGVSAVFFLPNGLPTLICVGLGLAIGCVVIGRGRAASARKQIRRMLCFLPFVGFVVLCNALFTSWIEAAWVGLKLWTVCVLMLAYGTLATTSEIARALAGILRPLQRFGLDSEEIYLLVAIAFRLMPILRRTFTETRIACRAKGAKWNLRTARAVLVRTSWQMLARVEQIERALIAKEF